VATPGAIEDNQGNLLANHSGLSNFTIGQRKGIGISGPAPLYVIDKDVERNTLIVGPKADLGRTQFTVRELNWVLGDFPTESNELSVQVRYRSPDVPARLKHRKHKTIVATEKPLNNVAPGQAAVFYSGEECLGGGIISR
jgi:tRNA-specific 2-thiouridylase